MPARRWKDEAKARLQFSGAAPLARQLHARLSPKRHVYTPENDRWRTIFIQVPKTGSTAVIDTIFGHDSAHLHHSAVQYRAADPQKFAEYYKFAFMRDPADRLISSYFFYTRGSGPDEVSGKDNRREWARRHLAAFGSFEEFVRGLENPLFRARVFANTHFRAQYEYFSDSRGQVIVDRIYRFEDMAAAIADLARRFGQIQELRRTNASARALSAADLDPRTRAIIERVYRTDTRLYARLPAEDGPG